MGGNRDLWDAESGQFVCGFNPAGPFDPTGRGDDYLDLTGQPLFPFGFGLSYTTFKYSNLKLIPSEGTNEIVTAQFEIENTGKVAGAEVAQLYVHEANPRLMRPEPDLHAFFVRGLAGLRFRPAELAGVPVKVWTPYELRYWAP